MKKFMAVMLSACMAFSLCACGNTATERNSDATAEKSTKNSKKITMVLDWTPNTNHTGIYVAQEKGYFKEAGLDVSVIQPPDDGATDLVASGGAEFGIDFQDTLAAAFSSDSPLPVTAVAAILQHNTSGLISLKKKGIDSPGKLEGHSYATWDSPIEQAVLKNVVEKDGGDFSRVKLISTYVEDIVAALHADIESVWIYYGWDGVKCDMEGLSTNFLPFADMNPTFDYYSPVIIGNNDYMKKNPDTTKAFLSAVKKGYEYAAGNPSDAADILLKAVPELDEKLVQKSQEYLSKQYIADAAQWGEIDANRWNGFYQWLNENKLVDNALDENAGFTMDYLK
ncbi:ABC transporter substrate-binding protein [Jutongia sp.]|uniref:ABC transporter substrate-binding protein n=1 Tax=Jutongia sp. TaxID=2944204 RepID=UPI003079939E